MIRLCYAKIHLINDLRNPAEISELCHQLNEPVFIAKNGYGDMVIMSMEAYEKSLAKLELYQKLAKAQIENGTELLDGKEVFIKLREKHAEKKA